MRTEDLLYVVTHALSRNLKKSKGLKKQEKLEGKSDTWVFFPEEIKIFHLSINLEASRYIRLVSLSLQKTLADNSNN